MAVLEPGWYNYGDLLHISSTNLHSWTTTSLPYRYMSLTTHQDKLVAVGGHHPTTHEATDQLLTSATGEDWQPSLPPMPTKRSRTSSISTGYPEVLVVAGGIGSDNGTVDMVEVLLGDQWCTTEPLPTPCYDVRSTVHEGNFYFTGGDGQRNTIYTCSCTSLIASCGLTRNDRITTSPGWRKVEAPRLTKTIVSYLLRLISIDLRYTIRGYCAVKQSWVETTSEGNRRGDSSDYLAAAVLPARELIVAHNEGVYRVNMSGKCV